MLPVLLIDEATGGGRPRLPFAFLPLRAATENQIKGGHQKWWQVAKHFTLRHLAGTLLR